MACFPHALHFRDTVDLLAQNATLRITDSSSGSVKDVSEGDSGLRCPSVRTCFLNTGDMLATFVESVLCVHGLRWSIISTLFPSALRMVFRVLCSEVCLENVYLPRSMYG